MSTKVKTHVKEVSEKTTVRIYGDHVPKGPIPTEVNEALKYVQNIPQEIGNHPVPIAVQLFPLSKLDAKAARLRQQVGDYAIDSAMSLFMELDELEVMVKDLTIIKEDGFVLWKEEWGRRNSYSVELLALGYAEPRDDTALPKRLLEAMRTRIDTARATGVFTDLSEKAKASEQTYWKSLNFKGISGSKTLEWNISA